MFLLTNNEGALSYLKNLFGGNRLNIDTFTPQGASLEDLEKAGVRLIQDRNIDPQRNMRLIDGLPVFAFCPDADRETIITRIGAANRLLQVATLTFITDFSSMLENVYPRACSNLEDLVYGISDKESLQLVFSCLESLIDKFGEKVFYNHKEVVIGPKDGEHTVVVDDHVSRLALAHLGFRIAALSAVKAGEERDGDRIPLAQSYALNFATTEGLFAGCKTAASLLRLIEEDDQFRLNPESLQVIATKTIGLVHPSSDLRKDNMRALLEGYGTSQVPGINAWMIMGEGVN